MERDDIYLAEIKDFSGKVVQFVKEVDFDAFVGDEKLQLAIKLIENIGEASKRVSPETKNSYPNIEWKKVAAMRDRLVHDYMDVDLEIVFDVATNEIPYLLSQLK